MSKQIDSVIKFIVKNALKETNPIARQTLFTVAVDIIKECSLSQKTRDWVVVKLINQYGSPNGITSFIYMVYEIILELVKLGVSRGVTESFLEQIIVLGWPSPARDLASGFLKRDLSLGEVRSLLKVQLGSAPHESYDEQSFLMFILKIPRAFRPGFVIN